MRWPPSSSTDPACHSWVGPKAGQDVVASNLDLIAKMRLAVDTIGQGTGCDHIAFDQQRETLNATST